MPRVKRGFKARRRRRRVLRHASGYYGARGRQFRSAIAQVHHAWVDAYRHRKARKRDFRRLWIVRIGAAAREHGLSYSRFIARLKTACIDIDRKMLSDLAHRDPAGFRAVVDAAQAGAQG
ncbi:MAG: 50S ribosomal protein L20 [Polyangiales bacterium]